MGLGAQMEKIVLLVVIIGLLAELSTAQPRQ